MRIAALTAILCCLYLTACATDAPRLRPPDMAMRQVERNVLVSSDQPKLRLRVDPAFTALPVLEFPIRHDTWVERYVFVDAAADKMVQRLVIVQFEHVQTGSSFRFLYPARPPMTWGDAVYRHGAFAMNAATEIAADPDMEVAQTQRYLAKHGYRAGDLWHVARLARVADSDGLSEVIVFYQEAVAAAQFVAPRSSEDNDLPDELAQALFARLNAAAAPE